LIEESLANLQVRRKPTFPLPAAGRTRDFFESAARCRINAAFRLASERRIYAAAKNFVVLRAAAGPAKFCNS